MENKPDSVNYSLEITAGNAEQKSCKQWSYFEKQREKLVIKQGYETGFIQDADLHFIRKETQCEPKDVEVLSLNNLRIRNLDGVQYCYRLYICNLCHNFIRDISALASCPNLAKIDLSHNQINKFPYPDFWAEFLQLKVLFLHDNGIGKLDAIHSLSLAPSLEYLTLFDSPISIRPSYRHHVVNSIITLKALDFHVISDEEVIEDALFGGRFASLSEHFLIDMVQMLSQSDDLETPQKPTLSMEKSALHNLYRKTNSILAKHSPVLIMQKVVRGYFARKFRNYLVQHNILSAEAVDGRTVPLKTDIYTLNKEVKPRPRKQSIRNIPQKSRVRAREEPAFIEEQTESRDQKVTFDENLPKDNLPEMLRSLTVEGQTTRQATILPGAPVTTPKSTNLKMKPHNQFAESSVELEVEIAHDKKLKRLEKILKSVNPEDVRPFINTLYEQPSSDFDWLQIASRAHQIKVEKKELEMMKARKAKSRATLADSLDPKKQEELIVPMEDVESEPPVKFRLKCGKANVAKSEPLKEHLYRIMESAKEVRQQHETFHRIVPDAPQPIRFKFTTLDQLIYARTKGCMSLATFLAVDKAYQAKDREEKLLANQEKVYELKLAKKKSKQRALMHQKRRAKEFSNLQDYDQAVTRAALKERDDYYNMVKEKYRHKYEESSKQHVTRREQYNFAKDFASHCSSIGNALRKHDLKVRREDNAVIMSKNIREMQDRRDEQKEIINKYVLQRQKVIQAESNAEKTEIELKILQDNKIRRDEIRERVSTLRRAKREVKELYPVPLHIHVGQQPHSLMLTRWGHSNYNVERPKTPRSPLSRLADRKILTNKSYEVIQQRARSAESRGTPAVVHVELR